MASFLEDVISGHENAMYGETGTSGLYHNSPTQTNYNINATSDLANRISQGVGSIPMAGPYLGGMTDLAMPALALGASPFYDTSQAIGKAKEKYGSSYGMVDDTEIPGGPTMGQLGTELNNQNILSSMFERSLGAATPLASKLSFNTPNFDFMGSAQASELTDLERDFPGMSTGDIIDSMNNRAFIGRQISPMAKPQIASPRTVIDPNRIPGRIQEAVEPQQYRIRDQLARDFLQGGLFRDAKNSLQQTGAALNEDFGGIKGKIGSGINNLIDNPVTRGLGAVFNLAKGNIPGMLMSGLGAIFNRDPNAPSYQQYSPQSYLKENNLSNIYNANPSMINDFYDDNPDSDTFNTTRFDRATTAFGKSRALFGPNGIAATKAKMAKAKADKAKAAAQAYKEKQAADAITAANNPYNPDGSRAAYNYAGRDNAQGTHTSTMSNAQAQANQDRGRGKYNQGGLASMFTRRR
mgnify:CR=1 FL=1